MKWEHILAALVVVLMLLLVIRIAYFAGEDADILPVLIDVQEPFYPVYYGSPEGDLLEPEFHHGIASIDQVLADLLAGPRLNHLIGIIPPETKVLGYHKTGGTLYVNFSHHLATNHPGGSMGEIMTVYGIVNSLTEISGVEKVQILLENQMVFTLAGHLDLTEPLHKDYAILGTSAL
ncbi:MAG: GerMN domain-containing protein [Firmicutes bacterium]|nr:GerMN domain-containing protein [Bacillota bacterium]